VLPVFFILRTFLKSFGNKKKAPFKGSGGAECRARRVNAVMGVYDADPLMEEAHDGRFANMALKCRFVFSCRLTRSLDVWSPSAARETARSVAIPGKC
jgi:hypothetical protein